MKKLMNYLIVTALFASLLGCTNEPEVIETPPVEPVVVDLVEPVVDEPVVNEIVVDEPVNNTYDISNIDISKLQQFDIITLGTYEQDGNLDNGTEPIEWYVIGVDGNRILLQSKYALDCKPFNETIDHVTWETCSLRKWLNTDFFNAAFTEEEQAIIPITTVENPKNPNGASTGNDTEDKVFCLNPYEYEQYYEHTGKEPIYQTEREEYHTVYNEMLFIEPTQYATSQGAFTQTIDSDYYNSWYGLMTYFNEEDVIGKTFTYVWYRTVETTPQDETGALNAYSHGDGCTSFNGIYNVDNTECAVLPALYIDLSQE